MLLPVGTGSSLADEKAHKAPGGCLFGCVLFSFFTCYYELAKKQERLLVVVAGKFVMVGVVQAARCLASN